MALQLHALEAPTPLHPLPFFDGGCITCRRTALRVQELEQANEQLRHEAGRAATRLSAALAELSTAQIQTRIQAQTDVTARTPWAGPTAAQALTSTGTAVEHLGARESQVLRLIAEGQRTPAIATRMGIAGATVEVHRRNIMRKLGLHSVAQLTKYALREGMTSL